MEISFLGQPLQFGAQVAQWLQERLGDPQVGSLQIGVAWVKRSGLLRLRDDFVRFRERGGKISVIIGIDEGGATEQGLCLALELFDKVYVFHEPPSAPGRTYHPKVYLASGTTKADLLVGSSNVTAGGLFSNYEASLECELDFGVDEDEKLLAQVRNWFDTLRSDNNACKLLDEQLLQVLLQGRSYYRIGNEDRPRRERQNLPDYDGVAIDAPEKSLFGRASIVKTGPAPRITPTHRPISQPQVQVPIKAAVTVAPQRWYKRMSASDAQQPKTTKTNPTGNLKLTQAGLNIDQETYFRQEMFGIAAWASRQTRRGIQEEAIVSFEVVIGGTDHGRNNLKIDHAEYRVAGQSNVPTWLHWGILQPILSANDYTGAWVIIERDDHGNFRLEITRVNPSQTL